MQAVVLSVGSELLRGDIVDTNAAFLTRHLSELGFVVRRVEQIGDDLDDLTDAFSEAREVAEVTICTGGLGPTRDDLTRQAIGASLQEELYCDESLLATIESRFRGMGRPMPPRNRRQAMLIPSAEAIPNPNGTAPGWYVETEGRIVVALPGPPAEMEPMWRDFVVVRLQALLPGYLAMRSLMTFGIGESAVEERIADVIHWRSDVIVATYAKSAGVEVHVTARAESPEEGRRLAGEAETRLRQRLGGAVFGAGDDTLSSVAGRMLERNGLSLAVMESATGGELANQITDTEGSSRYFRGGIVAYTAEAKAKYGVDQAIMQEYGLISRETALAMARAVRRQLGADIGLGVTGVAGSEPVEGHPPGTCFLALSGETREEVREIHRPARRDVIKTFAALCALDLLRRQLEPYKIEQV